MSYRQCTYCVMDTSAKEIVFDENGRCNFCKIAEESFKKVNDVRLIVNPYLTTKGKLYGKNIQKKYDCLIGLSGGVDSSYVLHKAIEQGFRPFCFSVDNGWNKPEADENIMRLVETLKVPFYRYVLDQKKFKELQASFMQAGVKNLEIPTDHVLMAITYKMASDNDIKYILSGGNVATESIMPESWGYQPRDLKHIKAIYKKFTGKKLKGLPTCSLFKFNWYKWIKGIKTVYLLDYLSYNRNEAGKILAEKYGWKETGAKHEESIFTQWFQSFYLFEKWGIDKRKAHLSSMIVSGQITRDEAMAELEKNPIYPKLGLEERVMKYPRKEYTEYPTNEKLFNRIGDFIKFLRNFGLCRS